ncbi:hypothetical protein ACFLZ0_01075 [Patescibacteria group bacterium]
MYKKPKFSAIPILIGLTANLIIPNFASFRDILASPYDLWGGQNIFKKDENIVRLFDSKLVAFQGHALVQQVNPYTPVVVSNRLVVITAYSSTPDQTDSTPFITAKGTYVRDGIIACNFLSFGTKVKIPYLFGDKIFVVEDRMALKNSHKIDIWFETREQAKQFGVKAAKIEILKYN